MPIELNRFGSDLAIVIGQFYVVVVDESITILDLAATVVAELLLGYWEEQDANHH